MVGESQIQTIERPNSVAQLRDACRFIGRLLADDSGADILSLLSRTLADLSEIAAREEADGIEIQIARSSIASMKADLSDARRSARSMEMERIRPQLQAALLHAFEALDWLAQVEPNS